MACLWIKGLTGVCWESSRPSQLLQRLQLLSDADIADTPEQTVYLRRTKAGTVERRADTGPESMPDVRTIVAFYKSDATEG